MVPPVLTCLIGKRLGDPHSNLGPIPAHFDLRDLSASLIALLCKRFGDSTHTLKPRLTRTCLKAFLDPTKPLGTHYGAIKGLHAIGGKESVRVLLTPNLKLYETVLREALNSDDESKRVDAEMVLKAIVGVLRSLEDEQGLVAATAAAAAATGGPDEMEMEVELTANGDGDGEGEGEGGGEGQEEIVGDVLRKRLADRIGEVVAEEVCKLGKRGLVVAILDTGMFFGGGGR